MDLGFLSIQVMNSWRSMPLQPKLTVTPSRVSLGSMRNGAPARAATSPSPVASMTRFARIAWRPDLLSVITPVIEPSSTITSTIWVWRSGTMSASWIMRSAMCLKTSVSSTW